MRCWAGRANAGLGRPHESVGWCRPSDLLLFTGLRKPRRSPHLQQDRLHFALTKNGRSFELPILDLHREILEPLRGLGREWVFPSPKAAKGHLTSPERLPWSPHAHRRTFATVAMEAGILEEIVGRLLNHTPISITGSRYARPSLDALRPAMQTACNELSRRMSAALRKHLKT